MTDVADTAEREAREAFSGCKRVWMRMGEGPQRRRSIALHALACFVPIAGPVFVMGRQLLWARSAAWRIEKPLPSFGGESAEGISQANVGEAFRIGFIGAVTLFAWMFVAAIVQAVLGLLPSVFGAIGGVIGAIFAAFVLVNALIAALRAAIYSSLKPGAQVGTAFALAAHRPVDLLRVIAFAVLELVVLAVVMVALLAPLAYSAASSMGMIPTIAFGPSGTSATLSMLPLIALTIIAIAFGAMYALVLIGFMIAGLLGDWMAEYDVASWGPSTEPLPFMRAEKPTPEPDAPVAPETTPASSDEGASVSE